MTTDPKEKYAQIRAALEAEYGYPEWRQHYPPVDELVLTILSQNTSDVNSGRAYRRVKARYDAWEAVRDADLDELTDVIRPAGLANQKAPRIQRALTYATQADGTISLDHLAEMPIDEAKAWLTDIKGIGPKTAAIILLFSFGMPAFPVDTHVHRVTGRLGLRGPKVSAEKAHEVLEEIVPPADYYPFHLNIIRHGREVCDARNPRCGVCVLQDYCDYFAGLSAEEQAAKRGA